MTKNKKKWKQTDFFEVVDNKKHRDLIISIEVRVPFEQYDGYEISIDNLNSDYWENVLWWFESCESKVFAIELDMKDEENKLPKNETDKALREWFEKVDWKIK